MCELGGSARSPGSLLVWGGELVGGDSELSLTLIPSESLTTPS